MKRGFLLMNTGSPDSAYVGAVRRYLKEFLMDPYVIDLPWFLRVMLVYGIILPRRPAKSAHAYHSIWTEHGSPLIHHCTRLAEVLSVKHDEPVELGMAYGNPSFRNSVTNLLKAGVDEICLLPMFPQHAMATVGSCVAGVRSVLAEHDNQISLRVVPPFYLESTYIDPLAEALKQVDEHILFSYHGLPEQHLRKTDPTHGHCLATSNCCEKDSPAHATCYRHQCLETTKAIVQKAELEEERYSIAFQSRLGRARWLQPYTDEELKKLPERGKKNLAVICPAFYCDCLETLEEIEIRGKEIFMAAGGESFRMIPCLNDTPPAYKCLETLMSNVDNWPEVKL